MCDKLSVCVCVESMNHENLHTKIFIQLKFLYFYKVACVHFRGYIMRERERYLWPSKYKMAATQCQNS